MNDPTIEQMQKEYVCRLLNPPPLTGNKCKKCGSTKVYSAGKHVEHCRACNNWQADF